MSSPAEISSVALQEPLLPPQDPAAISSEPTPVSVAAHDGDISDPETGTATAAETTTTTTTTEPLLVVVDERNWEQGHVQPKSCRDWPWAVLFLAQFGAIFILSILGLINLIRHGAPDSSGWWPGENDDNHNAPRQDDTLTDDGTSGADAYLTLAGLWFFLTLVASVVFLSALFMNLLLGPLSSMMIQISLVLSPISFGFTALISLVTLNIPMLLVAGAMSIFGVMYAWSVWHRIPFATANIAVAMAALRDNHGLWILAYGMTIKAYLWTAIWALTCLQVFAYSPHWVFDCDVDYDTNGDFEVCRWSSQGKFIVLGLFLSLFWTAQVLKNIFHTTIAGVVGTWWFDPSDARSASTLAVAARNASSARVMEQGVDGEDVETETGLGDRQSSCCFSFCGCSPAIFDSWVRSSVYSFGSICFGSLLVGVLRVLQVFVRCGRTQRRNQHSRSDSGDLCCCLLQCIVDHMERLMEYFNQWSFVYVGLYGYSYVEAGKQVSALFSARGWSVIVNDYLVSRSLAMMSLLIGLVTGSMGVVIGFIFFGPLWALPTFFIGMVLGMTSSNILFGVVVSAINTIFVCFAESPNQLRLNHSPELFNDLIRAWREAYPEDSGF